MHIIFLSSILSFPTVAFGLITLRVPLAPKGQYAAIPVDPAMTVGELRNHMAAAYPGFPAIRLCAVQPRRKWLGGLEYEMVDGSQPLSIYGVQHSSIDDEGCISLPVRWITVSDTRQRALLPICENSTFDRLLEPAQRAFKWTENGTLIHVSGKQVIANVNEEVVIIPHSHCLIRMDINRERCVESSFQWNDDMTVGELKRSVFERSGRLLSVSKATVHSLPVCSFSGQELPSDARLSDYFETSSNILVTGPVRYISLDIFSEIFEFPVCPKSHASELSERIGIKFDLAELPKLQLQTDISSNMYAEGEDEKEAVTVENVVMKGKKGGNVRIAVGHEWGISIRENGLHPDRIFQYWRLLFPTGISLITIGVVLLVRSKAARWPVGV